MDYFLGIGLFLAIVAGFQVIIYTWMSKRSLNSIKNRHVVITGGSSGIGLCIAIRCAKLGANVTIIARNVKKLESALEQIKQHRINDKQTIQYRSVDLSKSYDIVKNALSDLEEEIAPIYMFVNCAGGTMSGRVDEMSPDDAVHLMNINYYAVYFPTRYILTKMQETDEGIITITGSQMSLMGSYGLGPYSAAKFALRGLAESIAKELSNTNISITYSLFAESTNGTGTSTKPNDKKMLLADIGAAKPEDIAEKILRDSLDGKYISICGFELWLLATVHSGMSPFGSFLYNLMKSLIVRPFRLIANRRRVPANTRQSDHATNIPNLTEKEVSTSNTLLTKESIILTASSSSVTNESPETVDSNTEEAPKTIKSSIVESKSSSLSPNSSAALLTANITVPDMSVFAASVKMPTSSFIFNLPKDESKANFASSADSSSVSCGSSLSMISATITPSVSQIAAPVSIVTPQAEESKSQTPSFSFGTSKPIGETPPLKAMSFGSTAGAKTDSNATEMASSANAAPAKFSFGGASGMSSLESATMSFGSTSKTDVPSTTPSTFVPKFGSSESISSTVASINATIEAALSAPSFSFAAQKPVETAKPAVFGTQTEQNAKVGSSTDTPFDIPTKLPAFSFDSKRSCTTQTEIKPPAFSFTPLANASAMEKTNGSSASSNNNYSGTKAFTFKEDSAGKENSLFEFTATKPVKATESRIPNHRPIHRWNRRNTQT